MKFSDFSVVCKDYAEYVGMTTQQVYDEVKNWTEWSHAANLWREWVKENSVTEVQDYYGESRPDNYGPLRGEDS